MKDDFSSAVTSPNSAPFSGDEDEQEGCLDRLKCLDFVYLILGLAIVAGASVLGVKYFKERSISKFLRETAVNKSTCPDVSNCITTSARVQLFQGETDATDPCKDFYQFSCSGFAKINYAPSVLSGETSVASELNKQRLNILTKIVKGEVSTKLESMFLADPTMREVFTNVINYYTACTQTISQNVLSFVASNVTRGAATEARVQQEVVRLVKTRMLDLITASPPDTDYMRKINYVSSSISPNILASIRGIDSTGTGVFPTGFFDLVVYPAYTPSIKPILAIVPPFLSIVDNYDISDAAQRTLAISEIGPIVKRYMYPNEGDQAQIDYYSAQIVDFEYNLINGASWSDRPSRLPTGYESNLMTLAELQSTYGAVVYQGVIPSGTNQWSLFFENMGVPRDVLSAADFKVYVSDKVFMGILNAKILAQHGAPAGKETLVNYAAWSTVAQLAAISQFHGVPLFGIKYANIGGFNPYENDAGVSLKFTEPITDESAARQSFVEFGGGYHDTTEFMIRSALTTSSEWLAFDSLLVEARSIDDVFNARSSAIMDIVTNNVCVRDVTEKFPLAIARFFGHVAVTTDAKNEVQSIFNAVKEAFKKRMANKELEVWLDDATRGVAVEKVEAMSAILGFPDELLQSGFVKGFYAEESPIPAHVFQFTPSNVISKTDFFSNALITVKNMNSALFKNWKMEFSKSTLMVTEDWTKVNAYYLLNRNQIVFPMGFMQSEILPSLTPISMRYGSIGSIIAHEMAHAFDPVGIQYDKYGKRVSIITGSALTGYKLDSDCLEGHFTDLVFANLRVNGSSTLAENIADHVGVKSSWDAFNLVRNESIWIRLPGLVKYTEDQIFWIAYAQLWCSVTDAATEKADILSGVHSVPSIRVNAGLSLNENFRRVWQCPAGSPMIASRKCNLFKRSLVV